jgi:hypothetical protein
MVVAPSSKRFFFEKKNQKTSIRLHSGSAWKAGRQ